MNVYDILIRVFFTRELLDSRYNVLSTNVSTRKHFERYNAFICAPTKSNPRIDLRKIRVFSASMKPVTRGLFFIRVQIPNGRLLKIKNARDTPRVYFKSCLFRFRYRRRYNNVFALFGSWRARNRSRKHPCIHPGGMPLCSLLRTQR